MKENTGKSSERMVTACLCLVIVACVLVVVFKFFPVAFEARPALGNVVVMAPDSWIDVSKNYSEEEIQAQFQLARDAAEKARDAGYVVLYAESVLLAPDSAQLTPEFAAALEAR